MTRKHEAVSKLVLCLVFCVMLVQQLEGDGLQDRRYVSIWAGDSVITANLSTELDLTREQRRFISKTHHDIEPTTAGNLQYRDWLRDYLGNKSDRFDELVVQTWFAENRPELALMWMDIQFTSAQRKKLEEITIPIEVLEEIQDLQTELLKQVFEVAFSERQVERMIGSPYLVRDTVLRSPYSASFGPDLPDLMPFRLLCSPYVQKELGCTAAHAKAISEWQRKYRKNNWLYSTNPEDDDFLACHTFPEAEVVDIEKQVQKDLEELLDEEQWLRLRQLTNQRYVKLLEPGRAIALMGYDAPDERKRQQLIQKLFTTEAGVYGVARVLQCKYVASRVAEIMGDDQMIDQIVGEPSILKRGPTQPPDLSSPVLQRLLKLDRPANPRRRTSG